MSNRLAMDKAQSIQHLHDLGWSQRKIAATLSVDRKSVKRHLELASSKGTAPTAQAPTAPEEALEVSKGAMAPTGQGAGGEVFDASSSATPSPSTRSDCAAYHAVIVAALEQRLTAQRIYQDLIAEHGFTGSYWSVNRYAKRLHARNDFPFRRMETTPGEEAQIDYGHRPPATKAGRRAVRGQGRALHPRPWPHPRPGTRPGRRA